MSHLNCLIARSLFLTISIFFGDREVKGLQAAMFEATFFDLDLYDPTSTPTF